MRSHLTDEMLMEALEGVGAAGVERHLEECSECSRKVAEARSGLELAHAADVPEPLALFWEAFRRQVGRRISAGAPARGHWWLVPALASVAAVLIAFGVLRWPGVDPKREAAAVTLPAWSALPPAEEDEGLEVLQAMAAAGDALDAALPAQSVAGALSGLSDEESEMLAEALRAELGGRDAL